MHRFILLPILFALGACRARKLDAHDVPRVSSASAPTATASASVTATPPVYAGLPEWTLATTMREPPHAVPKGVANIVAHVPDRFDAREKLHLVIFFHGAVQCAAQLAQLGDVVCKEGDKPIPGYGYNARHDDAETSSLFAIPQFAYFGWGSPGRMTEKGYFSRFVDELVTETFAPGLGSTKTLDDVADITLIAHSAGFNPVITILQRGELADKVKNIVLLDSMFAGGEEFYLQWFAKRTPQAPRRLVAIHGDTGDSNGHHANLAKRLKQSSADVVVYPKGSLVEAIRGHEATIARMPVNHYWMPTMLLAKAIAGLDLPARSGPMPRVVANPRGSTALAFDTTLKEALTADDPALSNGSFADEYTLDLKAGAAIVVTITGGPSLTETCCTVDVAAHVFDGEQWVASDDDGAGAFDSRLAFTAKKTGKHTLRVTTSGSGYKLGPYSLRVTEAIH